MNDGFYTVRGYQLLRQNKKALTPAMEDYLEMIYRHTKGKGYVRTNELAEKLHVRASSATKMVQRLGELGFIQYKKYGMIGVTDPGREVGEYLLMRHNMIEEFLHMIGVRENLLAETELIEHYISDNTLCHLRSISLFLASHPDILEKYRVFVAAGTGP